MSCIKTGARVYLDNYGSSAPADLFAVGECIVVRFPQAYDECCVFDNPPTRVTHIVEVFDGNDYWWRKDLGVLVIPRKLIKEAPRG